MESFVFPSTLVGAYSECALAHTWRCRGRIVARYLHHSRSEFGRVPLLLTVVPWFTPQHASWRDGRLSISVPAPWVADTSGDLLTRTSSHRKVPSMIAHLDDAEAPLLGTQLE